MGSSLAPAAPGQQEGGRGQQDSGNHQKNSKLPALAQKEILLTLS